ncbi:MAG: hypothetical protein H0S78_12195, partial [Tissierellales bacterium]|nr:hypothetical protein [Tissierellales bacterium]
MEESKNENIEERPENIPIYQAEQIQINDSFFYSVKYPVEDFKVRNLFEDQLPLKKSTDDDLETVDISSDPYALDYFV